MMKKFLGSAAVLAMAATSGIAHADSFNSTTVGTTSVQILPPLPIFVNVPTGAIYSQSGNTANNTETASLTATNTWLIKGSVSPDCSYYGGASTAHTMDFGQIGVKTQNNVDGGEAFEMVSAATATASTTTAGCNTRNSVSVTKANGANGLRNTANVGGFDSNQFQANIPYSARVAFTGVASGSTAAGTSQTLEAATGAGSNTANFGAWRSAMTLAVNAPAPAKALLAGDYSDTLTVELKAL